MNSNDELRHLSESWIRVVTVFLALELAIITFTITNFEENKLPSNVFVYFAASIIGSMVFALATFLGVRDPRQNRFSIQTLIDGGVALTAISLYLSVIAVAYGAFLLSNEFTSLIPYIIFSLVSLIAYPFGYYKYLHKKTIT